MAESKKSLGTFNGVFTPSILTILGVIMYLKLGWVVGNVGLYKTLLIVTLATSITFLTGLSIAAIATDQRVRGGGAYYMISRSLGLEAGGAVGIPLFLAQALSVSLYTVGFAESFTAVFPRFTQEFIVMATIIVVAGIALLSPRLAIRTQYVVMGVVVLSIISLLFGSAISTEVAGASGTISEPVGFWEAFAVFFPAVTGITVGVNLSGDLKDPGRSIPLGTFLAIGTGYLVYMILPVILAFRAGSEALVADPLIMRPMSAWGDAILLGVWGGALSSAVGSILGAPRVLQALARDNVLPSSLRWMGRGTGPDDTPRIGTIITLIFAGTAAYLGNLEIIAPVLTMFFLTTYGALNVAAGLERFLRSPSFRPKFKIHWAFSLLGAVGCFWVMALINSGATLVASIFVGGVYIWLKKRELTAAWGDLRRGLWMAVIRTGLLGLRQESDARNWRPYTLVFSGAPTRRWHLVDLANCFSHSQGLLTVSTVVPEESITPERSGVLESKIRDYCERRGVRALVRVIPAPDAYSGVKRLVEAYGVGPLIPNSVLLGQNHELSKDRKKFCSLVSDLYRAKRNVFILRAEEKMGFRQ
ncbi:MAG: Na-K-Cl cotransporter, partial [bacterium]